MMYKIGQSAEFEKKITTEDVVVFSRLSGDINPIHLDEDFAAKSIFKNRLVHGMLCSSLISSVLANTLPGEGTIYLKQELKFLAPVHHEDVLIAKVTIVEILEEKNQMYLETIVMNKISRIIVISGTALVKYPKL